MLEFSIFANVILAIGILITWQKATTKIIEEKLATFSGCLNALTFCLVREEGEDRFQTAAFGIASLCGRNEQLDEDVKFYLLRASFMRLFRRPCLADVGEHLRYLALQTAGDDDETGNQIMEYISQPETDANGTVIELRDKFGEEALAAAQFVSEKKVLAFYRRQLVANPPKLIG